MAFVSAGLKSGWRGGVRWNGMNAKNRWLKLSNDSHGSLAAWLPRMGEARPAADVSPGKPGIKASKANDAPPLIETARPCQASPDTDSVRTSFIPTAISLGNVGCTAIDGSFCWSTSGGPDGATYGSAGKKSWVVTRTLGPSGACARTSEVTAAMKRTRRNDMESSGEI